MKVTTKLSLSKHDFQPLPLQSNSKKFKWKDKGTDLVLLTCPDINPWGKYWTINIGVQWSKSDRTKYPSKLDINLLPPDPTRLGIDASLSRLKIKSKFPYWDKPCLLNAWLPSTMNFYWVVYVVQENED